MQPNPKIQNCLQACADWGLIPTEFKQCMTWEEQVLWLFKFLNNTVIPAVNTDIQNVETLSTEFAALSEHVDEYFDNLDVQEEINNKIEQMFEDGELDILFQRYVDPALAEMNAKIATIKSGTPIAVDSTSDMTDTSALYLNTTNGYWYYYDATNHEWAQGGQYQTTGIQDGSININKFNASLNATFRMNEEYSTDQTITWTTGAFFNYTTGQLSPIEGYSYAQFNVNAGDAYLVTGYTMGTSRPLVAVNANGEVVDSLNLNAYTTFPYPYVIPDTVTKVYLNKRDNLGPQYKTPKFQKVTMMDLSQTLSDKYENRKLEISKWYAIGDSITEKNYRAMTNYVDYVSDDLKITKVNLGLSSSGFKQPSVENFTQRLSQITNYDPETEVITVMGGTNDKAYSSQPYLGHLGDTTMDTYYGALYTFFNTLFTTYPACRVGLITPTPINIAPDNYGDLIQAQIDVAKMFNVPVLNLYYEANLRPYDADCREECFKADGKGADTHGYPVDGVHPNSLGHLMLSNRVKEFVRSL